MQKVNVWQEKVILPTYETGKPEKNPVFIEKRVYQGSSGSVYPYPVIEKIEDVKVDKEYQAVYLENDFVKIMILPELGGRVQRGQVRLFDAAKAIEDGQRGRYVPLLDELLRACVVGIDAGR